MKALAIALTTSLLAMQPSWAATPHSNTLGPLITELGGAAGACLIDGGNDYDNLCVVERASGETTRVMHLRYGVATP